MCCKGDLTEKDLQPGSNDTSYLDTIKRDVFRSACAYDDPAPPTITRLAADAVW